MSRLHLLILWVLALGAGIYYFNSKDVPDSINTKADLDIGSNLVPGDLVETVDSFTVKSDDGEVTLKKLEKEWVVADKADFPASNDSVSRVFDALRNAKVAQSVVASDEYYDRFELDPETGDGEKPTVITLRKNGKETTSVYLGKTRESTGGTSGSAGRFVRLSNDDSGVYVVQEGFAFLNTNSENWINKALTPLEEGVVKMEVSAPNDDTFKPWVVSRATVQDDLIIEGLEEKEETKTNETATLKNIFAGATFMELVSEEDYKERANEKATRQLKATDSAGSTFLITVTPEKEKEEEKEDKDSGDPAKPAAAPSVNYLVSIEILNGPTKPEPLGENPSVQEKAVYAERVNNLADVSASVNRMRRAYEGRFFLVSKASIGSLTKNRGEFIQPKKEKKKPVTVATPPIAVPTPGTNKPNSPPPLITRPKDGDKEKPKIEAVTPPIQVPPIPKKPDAKDELGSGDAPDPVEKPKVGEDQEKE